MMRHTILLFVLTGTVFLFSCQGGRTQKENKPSRRAPRIAVSKAIPEKSYRYYIRWLKYGDEKVETFDMYAIGMDSALQLLETCDGLLLTGGEDVTPDWYGMQDTAGLCEIHNNFRDSLEFALLKKAFEMKMPVMGICRGHQLMNVFFGGSLIFDIPQEVGTTVIHRCQKADTCRHPVRVEPGSLLQQITGVPEGIVNTSHHQGVRELAPVMDAYAFTNDSLIESIGLKDSKYPFMLGVQWHPERLDYEQNPLSGKIAGYFLKKVNEYKAQKTALQGTL